MVSFDGSILHLQSKVIAKGAGHVFGDAVAFGDIVY
jgi:hypothetical protein